MSNTKQSIEIQNNEFFTNKVKLLFKRFLSDDIDFDQKEYAITWLKFLDLYKNSMITRNELIGVGVLLLKRKIPKEKGIGAFTEYGLFELLELSNSLFYYITTKEKTEVEVDSYCEELLKRGEVMQTLISQI